MEDVPLITNRHRNKAIKLLGKTYKTKMNPPEEYPEIGAVEVNNAVNTVTNLLSDLEHLENKRSLRGITYTVLDKGYVKLVDWFGTDERIVEAARVSYNSSSKGEEQDKKLLFYLWKNQHSSPFEQCSITFNIKLPLFVQAQLKRNRTQRLNEQSYRYTKPTEDFYIPSEWRKQDTKNKQGSITTNDWNDKSYYDGIMTKNQDLSADLENHCTESYKLYKEMIENGVAKEMARMVLPQNLYTEIYTNWDLNNLTKFFTLRMDEHAQWEIRQYAKVMYDITKQLFPWVIEAFDRFKFKLIDVQEDIRNNIENGK